MFRMQEMGSPALALLLFATLLIGSFTSRAVGQEKMAFTSDPLQELPIQTQCIQTIFSGNRTNTYLEPPLPYWRSTQHCGNISPMKMNGDRQESLISPPGFFRELTTNRDGCLIRQQQLDLKQPHSFNAPLSLRATLEFQNPQLDHLVIHGHLRSTHGGSINLRTLVSELSRYPRPIIQGVRARRLQRLRTIAPDRF